MRTNIDIDDTLMATALKAGPYKTKKDAVEAGLKLIARQAAYREILKWRGKLHWDAEPWAEPDRRSPQQPPAPAVKSATRGSSPAAKKRAGNARR